MKKYLIKNKIIAMSIFVFFLISLVTFADNDPATNDCCVNQYKDLLLCVNDISVTQDQCCAGEIPYDGVLRPTDEADCIANYYYSVQNCADVDACGQDKMGCCCDGTTALFSGTQVYDIRCQDKTFTYNSDPLIAGGMSCDDFCSGVQAECSDGIDNDGDGDTDTNDDGCHTDGDSTNPASYDSNDNDETNCGDGVCEGGETYNTCSDDCPEPECGDGNIDAGESCDGSNLGGETCETQGFDDGTLACNADCTFDTSGCGTYVCGNNIKEGTEVCDGTDLDGETCTSQGFTSGTLVCEATCDAFDTSGCECTESWSCDAWDPEPCSSGETQTRTCTDSNNCGTELTKPSEERDCPTLPEGVCVMGDDFEKPGDPLIEVKDQGGKTLSLKWDKATGDVSPDNYYVYRFDGEDYYYIDKIDSCGAYCQYDYSNVDFGTTYTYLISASYHGLESYSNTGSGSPGDDVCEGRTNDDEFCGALDRSYYCDEDNKMKSGIWDCFDGGDITDPTTCVELSGGNTQCRDNTQICDYADGAPFDLYFDSGDLTTYAIIDSSYTTVDDCYSCENILDCYDYKSEDACNGDRCNVGQGNCDWEEVYSDLGKGVCVNTEKDNCKYCSEPGTQGASNIGAYNEIFDVCTAEKANKLSTTNYDCYFIESTKEAKSCQEMTCYDYNDTADCSSDVCGLGVCSWISDKCVKDSDSDGASDCSPGDTDCYEDMTPPETTVSYAKFITSDEDELKFDIKEEGTGVKDTFVCIDQSDSCSPTNSLRDDKIKLNGIGRITYAGTLENGLNYVRYYSIDKAKNTEAVKSTTFRVDGMPPEITDEADGEQQHTQTPVQIGTEYRTKLTTIVNTSEMAKCSFTLTKTDYSDNEIPSVEGASYDDCYSKEHIRNFEEGLIVFDDTHYTEGLIDGWYNLHAECEDIIGNSGSNDFLINIDSDPTITIVSPGPVFSFPIPDLVIRTPSDADCRYDTTQYMYDAMAFDFTGKEQLGEVYEHTADISSIVSEGRNIIKIACKRVVSETTVEDRATIDPVYDITEPTINAYDSAGIGFIFSGFYANPTTITLRCRDGPRNIADESIGFGCIPLYCLTTTDNCTPSLQGPVTTINGKDGEVDVQFGQTIRLCYQAVEDGTGSLTSATECKVVNIDSSVPVFDLTLEESTGLYYLQPISLENYIGKGSYNVTITSNEDLKQGPTLEITPNVRGGKIQLQSGETEWYGALNFKKEYSYVFAIFQEYQDAALTTKIGDPVNIPIKKPFEDVDIEFIIEGYDTALPDGNLGTYSEEYHLKVESPSAPTISVSSDYIKSGETITVSGSVSSTTFDDVIEDMSIDIIFSSDLSVENGVSVKTDINPDGDGDYSVSVSDTDLSSFADGTLYVFAKLTDPLGNYEHSTAETITKDFAAPTITKSPTGITGVNLDTNGGVVITAAFTDDTSGIDEDGFKMKIENTDDGSFVGDGDGDEYLDSLPVIVDDKIIYNLETGLSANDASVTYEITIEIKDKAGNQHTEIWNFTADPNVPSAPSWSSTPNFGTGSTAKTKYVKSLTPTINVNFVDADNAKITKVELDSGVLYDNLDEDDNYDIEIPSEELTDGNTYTLTVYAKKEISTGVYGAENSYSIDLVIDTTYPKLLDLGIGKLGENYYINVGYSETNIHLKKVIIGSNNYDIDADGYAGTSITDIDDFDTFNVKLKDKAGNQKLVNITQDNSRLTLNTVPAYTQTSPLTVTGTSSDLGSTIRAKKGFIQEDSYTADAYTGAFSVDVSLENGNNEFIVYSFVDTDDVNGFENVSFVTDSVFYDSANPILDEKFPDTVTPLTTPEVYSEFTDDAGIAETGYTMKFYAQGSPEQTVTPEIDAANNKISYQVPVASPLLNGYTYNVRIEGIEDKAGNLYDETGILEWSFIVDTNTPALNSVKIIDEGLNEKEIYPASAKTKLYLDPNVEIKYSSDKHIVVSEITLKKPDEATPSPLIRKSYNKVGNIITLTYSLGGNLVEGDDYNLTIKAKKDYGDGTYGPLSDDEVNFDVDLTSPAISSITADGEAYTTGTPLVVKAENHEIIVTADEELSLGGIECTSGGDTFIPSSTTSGNNLEATLELGSAKEGAVDCEITIVDIAGNLNQTDYKTSDGNNILRVDKTGPGFTLTPLYAVLGSPAVYTYTDPWTGETTNYVGLGSYQMEISSNSELKQGPVLKVFKTGSGIIDSVALGGTTGPWYGILEFYVTGGMIFAEFTPTDSSYENPGTPTDFRISQNLVDTELTFKVEGYDTALADGNLGELTNTPYKLDVTPPLTATITQLKSNSDRNYIKEGETLNVSGSLTTDTGYIKIYASSDNVFDDAVDTLLGSYPTTGQEFTVGTTAITFTIGDLNISSLVDGTVYIFVEAFDQSANSRASSPASIVKDTDTNEPTISFTSPTGTPTRKDITDLEDLDAILYDSGSGIKENTICIKVTDGTNYYSDNANDCLMYYDYNNRKLTYEFSISILSLPDGTYTISIDVSDNVGHAATTETTDFVIDSSIPDAPNAEFEDGNDVNTIEYWEAAGSERKYYEKDEDTKYVLFTFNDIDVEIISLVIEKDGSEIFSISNVGSNLYNYQHPLLTLTAGTYKFEISAHTDLGGSYGTEHTWIYYLIVDNIAPFITVDGYYKIENKGLPTENVIEITGPIATDIEDVRIKGYYWEKNIYGIEATGVNVIAPSPAITTPTSAATEEVEFEIDFGLLGGDGDKLFNVTIFDKAENNYTIPDLMIKLDKTPPTAPDITSTTHPTQTDWYTQTTADISWTEPDVNIVEYSHIFVEQGTTPDDSSGYFTDGTTTSSNSLSYDLSSLIGYDGYGEIEFYVKAKDSVGNWGGYSSYLFKIDVASPEVTWTPRYETVKNEFQTITVNIDGTGSDVDCGSIVMEVNGVNKIPNEKTATEAGCTAEAETTISYTPDTSWLAGLEERVMDIELTVADEKGNSGTFTNTFTIDSRAPAIKLSDGIIATTVNNGDYLAVERQFIIVEFSNEMNGCEIELTEGAVNTITTELYSISYDKIFTYVKLDVTKLDDGDYTLNVTATDVEGYAAGPYTTSFVIDNTAPTGPFIVINEENALYTDDRQVSLTLSATEDSYSDADEMMISGSEYFGGAQWEDYLATKLYTLSSGDEEKTVYVKFKNKAGLESDIVNDTIILDTEGPTIYDLTSTTHSELEWSKETTATFSWDALDPNDISGVAGYWYILDTTQDTEPAEGTGTYITTDTKTLTIPETSFGTWYFHIRAIDNAGNSGDTEHYTLNIDIEDPVASNWNPPFGEAVKNEFQEITVNIDGTGSDVDCDSIVIEVNGVVYEYDDSELTGCPALTFTPSSSLATGLGRQEVIVGLTVADNAGNENGFMHKFYIDVYSAEVILTDGTTDVPVSNDDYIHPGLGYNKLRIEFDEDVLIDDNDFDITKNEVYLSKHRISGEGYDNIFVYELDSGEFDEGYYEIKVHITNTFGEYFGPQTTTFTIDNSGPTNPDIIINNDADYTNDDEVSLALSAREQSFSEVTQAIISESSDFSSSQTICSGADITESNNIYSCTKDYIFNDAGNGVKTIYAKFMNRADVESNVVSDTIILDAEGPTIFGLTSTTHPIQTEWYKETTAIFSWDALDPNDISGVAGYNYVLDTITNTEPDEIVELAATTKELTKTIDIGEGNSGTRYFHIRAIDNAGNSGDTEHYTLNIDREKSTINLVQPITKHTNSQSPAIVISTGEKANCTVSYTIIGGSVAEHNFTTSDNLEHTLNVEQFGELLVPDEITSFNVRCIDFPGNSEEKTFDIYIDTTDSTIEASLTHSSAVKISEEYNSKDYEIYINPITRIRVNADEEVKCRYSETQEDYEDMPNEFETEGYSPTPETSQITLQDGNEKTYYIDCEDKAGNKAAYQFIINVKIDLNYPVHITDAYPTGFINNNRPIITLKTDVESECRIDEKSGWSVVAWIVDIFTPAKDMFTTDGLTHKYPESETGWPNDLEEENYEFTIDCDDKPELGRGTGTADVEFTVDVTPPDKPLITAPDNETVTGYSMITVSGTAEADSVIKVFNNGNYQKDTTADGNGGFSLEVDIVSGVNAISAKAVDQAGNTGEMSDELIVIYVAVAPQFNYMDPNDGDKRNNVDEIIVRFNLINEVAINFGESEINVTKDNLPFTGTTVQYGTSNTDIIFTRDNIFTNGDYSVSIFVKDVLGNTATYEKSFTVDNRTPDINIISPEQGLRTNEIMLNIMGNVSSPYYDISDIKIKYKEQEISVTMPVDKRNVDINETITLVDEGYNGIEISATNERGTAIVTRNVELDITGPGAIIEIE